jgi:ribosome assembly protein RRB1
VASADHKLTLWDFSVEVDDAELEHQNAQLHANGMDVPP